MKSKLLEIYKKYPISLKKGEGSFLIDSNGKKYLDFLSGIAVNAFGYGNKKILKAINDQSKNLIHCSNLFHNEQQIKLANLLSSYFKDGRVFLCNSGTEANEFAIKFARKYGLSLSKDKIEIISFYNSFHGRTLGSLSATAQPKMHIFGPLIEGFRYVTLNDFNEFKKTISGKTCAVILEVIQMDGGVNFVDKHFVSEIQKLCKKNKALLIFDEIQTGLGRTGKFFAYENYGISPDIVTVAKPLGGGIPLGAAILKNSLANIFTYGDHGSTFGGNPVACAVAVEIIKMLSKKKLSEIQSNGKYLLKKLSAFKSHKHVKDIRGIGLICAMELNCDPQIVVAECLKKGFIINSVKNNTIRFIPPYTIKKSEIDSLIKALSEIFKGLN